SRARSCMAAHVGEPTADRRWHDDGCVRARLRPRTRPGHDRKVPCCLRVRSVEKEIAMSKNETQELGEAVQLYLDLMYDCDTAKFDRVFYPSSQLHGLREGKMTCWPAAQYKDVLASRKSPKAQGSKREEQVLLLDVASPTQALAKVRVRIND